MTFNAFYPQPHATNLGTPTSKIREDEPVRSKRLLHAATLLLFFVFLSAPVFSQTVTASASGVCHDDQGAVLVGVSVSIKNIETGIRRVTATDSTGRYYLALLSPGRYEIQASMTGFRTEVRKDLTLTSGQEALVGFVLHVGPIEERSEVAAEAGLIDTTTPTLSEIVDQRKVRDLPLNGRDIVQLIQLQPGVNVARSDAGDILTGGKGTRITVAGVRPSGNVFMLDGTIINNLANRVATGATGQLTGVETVKEFRVLTSNYSSEFSRVFGGAFNIITRSGTNSFHGSLFEFIRNDSFDARNFFDVDKPGFKRNQFGFSIGGPIIKERSFFFASYEGLRERAGVTVTRTVPDLESRNGVVAGRPVAIAQSVIPYLDIWPLPTTDPMPGDGSALFVGTFNQPGNEDFFNLRVDHSFSEAHTALARYTFSNSDQLFLPDTSFPEFPNQYRNRPQYLTLQLTSVFSPTLLNELRFGFARTKPLSDTAPENPFTELGFIAGQPLGTISISGFDVFGTDRDLPRRLIQNSFQFSDGLTALKGRHSLKIGVQFERFQYNLVSSSRARGEFTFANLTDFLTARARTFEGLLPEANDVTRGYRQNLFGSYFQDEFRVLTRLTLSLGIRHEFVTVPTEQHGRLNNIRDPLDLQITVGDPFVTQKANFAPRVGFAWSATGDGKTSVRGGFGIFFDHFLANQWFNSITRLPPFAITARATGSAAKFPDGLTGLSPLARDAVFGVDYDHGQPYVYQYNVSAQREVANNTVVTAAYVGGRGVKLAREADWNIGELGNIVRRNPNFSRIRFRTWDANSFYNSVQVGVNRRFSDGFQVQGAYTFSKSVDDSSSGLGRSEFNNGQQRTSDPFDHKADRGLSSFDVRHNLVVNFTVELPFGKQGGAAGSSGTLERLLSGWQLSGIATFSSGTPFTPIIINDLDLDGTDDNEQRPNVKAGKSNNPFVGRPEQWFDPSAFQSLEPGTRGDLGRNTIIGPGVATFDLAVARNFRIARVSDEFTIQLRTEVFNLLNHANFSTPPRSNLEIFNTAGADAQPLPNAGRITSTIVSSRQLQFALRVSF